MICMAFFAMHAMGQEETKEKRVVIVKEVEKDGKVVKEVHTAKGKEADEMIKKMKSEGDFESIEDIEIMEGDNVKVITKGKSLFIKDDDDEKQELEIEKVYDEDGNLKESYRLVTEKDGAVIMETWDGQGDAPENIKKLIEKEDVHTIIVQGEDDTKHVWVSVDKEDKKHKMRRGHPMRKERKMRQRVENKPPENKAKLGVVIDDEGYGVVVSEVLDGSAAMEAGIQSGDVILKINDFYIFSMDGLLTTLRPYLGGEMIKVTVIREGKEIAFKAKLKS